MRYLIILICLVGSLGLEAQFAWIEPAVPDVNEEVTIYVDVAQDPVCSNLTNSAGPLYIWTWGPNDPTLADGNGSWGASNEALIMENVEGTIWSISFVPTELYGEDAAVIYEKGLDFLAKEKDGGSGGDCAEGGGEFKTSDIHLDINSPFALARKVYSIPDRFAGDTLLTKTDDAFSLFFDQKLEVKDSLVNADNFWLYYRIKGDDGNVYKYSNLSNIGDFPELALEDIGNGVYQFSCIPEDFVIDILPEGVEPVGLILQIVTLPLCGADCAVDGEYIYTFKCD